MRQGVAVALLFLLAGSPGAQAQVGTAFTYQGRLTDASTLANGSYDMEFRLYDALSGPAQVGSTVAKPGVTVSAGLFTVPLDFGGLAFSGNERWLEISVKLASGSTYTVLAPRQELTPVPNAIYAGKAGDAVTVSGLTCTNGQVLKWSGSAWTCGTDVGGGGNVTAVTATGPLSSSGGTTPNLSLTGIIPVASGGTGSATQNFVDLTTNQTVGGDKTLSGNLILGDSSTSAGNIMKGPNRFIHDFGGNTFMGVNAGNFTTTGAFNIGIGQDALKRNTSGISNTATGYGALRFNTSGDFNAAFGFAALGSNATGQQNTAIGWNVLSNSNGNENTAIGWSALTSNTTGNDNAAMGTGALYTNTTGSNNTASGVGALMNNNTGSNNTAVGLSALLGNTTGSNNIGVGQDAGINLTTGDNNIAIGNSGIAAEANTIRIGTVGTHLATFIAGNTTVSGTLAWTGAATGDISGSAASVTGIVPVANGGTGSASQNFVDLTAAQTVGGTKTFSSPIVGSVTGSAASAATVAGLVCADGQVLKWSGSAWTCGADTSSLVYDAGTQALLTGAKTVIGQGTTGADGTAVVNLTPPAAFSSSSYVCAVTLEGFPGSPAPGVIYTSGTQFKVEIFANKPFRFMCIGT